MTKKEKQEFNRQIGLIWMELRALENTAKKSMKSHPGYKGILAKYQLFIENNDEIKQSILIGYPRLFEPIKELRYTKDIKKTMQCLNFIVPTDG